MLHHKQILFLILFIVGLLQLGASELRLATVTRPPFAASTYPSQGYAPFLASQLTRSSRLYVKFYANEADCLQAIKDGNVDGALLWEHQNLPAQFITSNILCVDDLVFITHNRPSKKIRSTVPITSPIQRAYLNIPIIPESEVESLPISLVRLKEERSGAVLGSLSFLKNLYQADHAILPKPIQYDPRVIKRITMKLVTAKENNTIDMDEFNRQLSIDQFLYGYQFIQNPILFKPLLENRWSNRLMRTYPGAEIKSVPEKEDLIIPNDYWAPFTSPHLPAQGILSQIVKDTFHLGGYTVTFEAMPSKEAMRATRQGRFAATFAWEKNTKRNLNFVYSELPLISLTTDIFHTKPDFNWEFMDDLINYKIGLTQGFYYGHQFTTTSQLSGTKIQYSGSDDETLKALLDQQCDLAFINRYVAAYLLKELQQNNLTELKVHPTPLYTAPHYLLISKQKLNHQTLKSRFDEGHQVLIESGLTQDYFEELLLPLLKIPVESKAFFNLQPK